jgi:dolichyl-phosphate beta-glucosyltransferase
MNKKTLAVVVPCYNEASRLKHEEFIRFSEENPDIHFYFANDGSQDNTSEIISSKLVNNSTRFIADYKVNKGKAETIRQTVIDVYKRGENYSHYAFIDADLAIPLEQLLKLRNTTLTSPGKKMFITVRTEKEFLQSGKTRYYVSKAWKFLFTRLLFGLRITDSQCGCKLFDSSVIEKAFAENFISRWLFDIEIVFRIMSKKCELLEEVPIISLNDNSNSSISNRTIILLLKDATKIYAKYKLRKSN